MDDANRSRCLGLCDLSGLAENVEQDVTLRGRLRPDPNPVSEAFDQNIFNRVVGGV